MMGHPSPLGAAPAPERPALRSLPVELGRSAHWSEALAPSSAAAQQSAPAAAARRSAALPFLLQVHYLASLVEAERALAAHLPPAARVARVVAKRSAVSPSEPAQSPMRPPLVAAAHEAAPGQRTALHRGQALDPLALALARTCRGAPPQEQHWLAARPSCPRAAPNVSRSSLEQSLKKTHLRSTSPPRSL